ncbi:hypothetical protein RchiOBHm_Chr1g0371221 [Rosa chinensis]|uniref:Uncharacterized protein n=1 Tax=Rosa chinensis TaxID=74649 RepID=A0A2P6SLI3_ROSCH|nr:hypothetical protein RchiOBHm_Chr1g0371221 [Rosa chinensis]
MKWNPFILMLQLKAILKSIWRRLYQMPCYMPSLRKFPFLQILLLAHCLISVSVIRRLRFCFWLIDVGWASTWVKIVNELI